MQSLQSFFSVLEKSSKQHAEMQRCFRRLFQEALDDFSTQGFPVQGITIQEDSDRQSFLVTFVGRIFRFEYFFYFAVDGNEGLPSGIGKAQITCSEVLDSRDFKQVKKVDEFTLTPDGATDISVTYNGSLDKLNIHNSFAARYIIFSCLTKALTTPNI